MLFTSLELIYKVSFITIMTYWPTNTDLFRVPIYCIVVCVHFDTLKLKFGDLAQNTKRTISGNL